MAQVVSLAKRPSLLLASVLLLFFSVQASGEEVVVDFEQAPIRLDPNDDEKISRLETYEEKGVRFRLSRQPEKSKASGRIMFFSHISSGRKGILNAMANEQQIPVQVRFPEDVNAVTIRFWASTGTSALLEAFDDNDQSVAQDELLVVPGRTRPEDPIPMFELTVKADRIAYVEFSGPRTGEYLAADEIRFTTAANHIAISVDAESVVGELRSIWNFFGYDEALTTLTPEGQHLLGELRELDADEPIHIRTHHLLTSGDRSLALKWSSTNVYTEDAAGNPVYDWTTMDQIMDELTRPGIEPFVQGGFMPQDLSSKPEPYTPALVKRGMPRNMVSGGAFYPPKDYKKWEQLIATWAQHCAERYGQERASSWLWEAWNEPESPYWKGTQEEFFKLYDHFASGVKRVLPNARVGGPHVTDPGWKNGDAFMRAFLEHCRSGRNAATGEIGSPLDFIAFHAKGTTRLDDHGRVEMNLRNQLATIQTYGEIISSFPEFAALPVYIGESDPEGCAGCPATLDPERGYRLTSQFAAYTAASFMRKQDLLTGYGVELHGAVSWAFTFHDQPWFNGLRALTSNEIALPVFNCFKLFSRLDRNRISVTNPMGIDTDQIIRDGVRDKKADVGAVATTNGANQIHVLLWHYHDVGTFEPAASVTLNVRGLPIGQKIEVSESRLDQQHGNAYTAWVAMGAPQDPTPKQVADLQSASAIGETRHASPSASNGRIQLNFTLPRQSVSLFTLRW